MGALSREQVKHELFIKMLMNSEVDGDKSLVAANRLRDSLNRMVAEEGLLLPESATAILLLYRKMRATVIRESLSNDEYKEYIDFYEGEN